MSSLGVNTAIPIRSTRSKPPSPSHVENLGNNGPLSGSRDARQIVRLVQCPQCSYPLREPMTLPCANTICKECIPELHQRTNISYPADAKRLQGFRCPLPSCKMEHAVEDISVDVVLNKIMAAVESKMEEYREITKALNLLLRLEENKRPPAGTRDEREPSIETSSGGRLVSTYFMARRGSLERSSEVKYTPLSCEAAEKSDILDTAVLEDLKEATRSELDCQVCYSLFLDPFTTACGHTFCRSCLGRTLDHANLCPICRRKLEISPGIKPQHAPSNVLMNRLLVSLCPEAVAARQEAQLQEENIGLGELNTPLFVCTLSFPSVPTFLHIFEPRYRLMIRRACDSGDRTFGMLLHNPTMEIQGDLGPVPFFEYGTLLYIKSVHLLADGRSLIETFGVSRFKVLDHGSIDGYTVGKIERVDDIAISEEEATEAEETQASQSIPSQPATSQMHNRTRPYTIAEVTAKSTQELMEIGTSFVKRMRDESAPWLRTRVCQAYGDCPDNPALFPWWFASVLPMSDSEKYKLLSTSSVRERLKICVGWIGHLETQRRYASLPHSVVYDDEIEDEEMLDGEEEDEGEESEPEDI